MPDGQLTLFCRRLRGLLSARGDDAAGDAHLLNLFVAERDEAAFTALVRRHGPMVLGVCRRVLRDSHDADDAFQATFLVLARKAAGIARRELLANWLYGVAYRTAMKAKTSAARRRRREREAPPMPVMEPNLETAWRELRPVLDEELARLPAKYRKPILLCCMEGKTHEEAAALLGWPTGTVAGRLSRARAALRERLVQRGVSLSGVVLASVLSSQAASASVPAALVTSTVQAALGVGVVSASVAALSKGVLHSMLMTKLKMAGLCVVAVGFVSAGAGLISQASPSGRIIADTSGSIHVPAASAKAIAEEKEKLDGTWKVVSGAENGRPLPEEATGLIHFTFTGDKLKIMAGDDERASGAIQINPKASPKTIDIMVEKENHTAYGIYELKGDELKICLNDPTQNSKDRPSTFESKDGSRQVFFVLRRVNPDEKPDPEKAAKLKELSARSISANNLKQIVLAMHNYASTFNHLPAPAIYGKNGQALLSWRVTILPYIEQDQLYKQFHMDEPWDSEHNKSLLPMMPRVYAPVLGGDKNKHTTFYRVFVGPGAAFEANKELHFTDFTDGTSNTILAVEAGEAVLWTKPDELEFSAKQLPKLGGQFKQAFPIALADGSVHFIDVKVDEKLLRPFITRNGGEVVNFDDLKPKPKSSK